MKIFILCLMITGHALAAPGTRKRDIEYYAFYGLPAVQELPVESTTHYCPEDDIKAEFVPSPPDIPSFPLPIIPLVKQETPLYPYQAKQELPTEPPAVPSTEIPTQSPTQPPTEPPTEPTTVSTTLPPVETTPPQQPHEEYGPPQQPHEEYGPPQYPHEEYGPPQQPHEEYGPPQQPHEEYGPPQHPHEEYGPPATFQPPITQSPPITLPPTIIITEKPKLHKFDHPKQHFIKIPTIHIVKPKIVFYKKKIEFPFLKKLFIKSEDH